MAQRKLQQEIDKTFKKVAEGIQAFEGIYDKIAQTTNASQKEKLEDALKREIKKLQRQRDQIKTWAASNEIKDKKPLLEQRKLIETQMEKFKAVEKEMKTKAYSKEGLSAAAKLDPKEKEKLEACQFLSNMVEELERQIETLEAEAESLQATMKKGKKDTSKADRVQEVERLTERHKWHQGKLEQILRALENGSLETEQVTDLEESIKYYVENNQDVDFAEDEEIYDELNLDEEDDAANNDGDRVSSQDAQSVQDEPPEMDSRPSAALGKSKATPATDSVATAARRPSTQQTKSPLPALATLHTPLSNVSNGTAKSDMKPAPLPARAPGETLKYASAAAAAAASDKNSLGIAPLPPPPGAPPASTGISPLPPASATKALSGTSPSAASSQPTSSGATPSQKPTVPVISADSHAKSPALSQASTTGGVARVSSTEPSAPKEPPSDMSRSSIEQESQGIQANGASGPEPSPTDGVVIEADESIFHLPAGLQELIQSFETTKTNIPNPSAPATQRLLAASQLNVPESFDAEKPRHYRPKTRYNTPPHYPQESLPIFDDPRLYSRIDTDTLFYVFYYQQGTYQQFLAAKALKNQSWRFHKQYQTWFQRHEEPKIITEEFEQGTYRFFDYESTWMNRRKADFKFVYKFLEDDL